MAIPTVKISSARPRRLEFDSRMPTHATTLSTNRTYSSGTSQSNTSPARPMFRCRYSFVDNSGPRPSLRNRTSVATAITAAAEYCMTARRRVTSGVRVDATDVIITKLPAAEATSAI